MRSVKSLPSSSHNLVITIPSRVQPKARQLARNVVLVRETRLQERVEVQDVSEAASVSHRVAVGDCLVEAAVEDGDADEAEVHSARELPCGLVDFVVGVVAQVEVVVVLWRAEIPRQDAFKRVER